MGLSDVKKAASNVISSSSQYPFLFVGSGLSRRYLGSPDWVGLIRDTCTEVLGDPYAYAGYVANARSALGVSTIDDGPISLLPEVASMMEADVSRALLSDSRFEAFRSSHESELASASVSPMKLFIADRLSALKLSDGAEEKILSTAGRGKISGVITTNYDLLCENLFPSFDVRIGERGMIFHDSSFAQELYKIHGSVSDPDSMVLTSSDYRAFDEGKDYLVAKLLTIFLEFPVIFLGYSIQDENIRKILASVARCVGQSRMDAVRERMLFVRYSPGSSGSVGTVSFALDGAAMEMTCVETDDFTPVYEAIAESRKTFPLKLVRELKGNVYRLASEIDPASDVAVAGLESILNSPDSSKKVVIGVAKFSGEIGCPLTPEDVFKDIVLDDLYYDPKDIERHYLNSFVRRLAKAVPIFKYASALDWKGLGPDVRSLVSERVSLESFRTNTHRKYRRNHEDALRADGKLSVEGMIKAKGRDMAYKDMAILNEDEIDVPALGSYLADLLMSGPGESLLRDSSFRKMVIIYDFMRYRYGKSPDLNQ